MDNLAIFTIIVTGIITIIATFIGAWTGAQVIIRKQELKNSYPRKLISDILVILSSYKNYSDAQSEFNKYSIVEKKAVVVALKNLGVPIRIGIIDDAYDIENITFDNKVVSKEFVAKMIDFVNKGLCDDLFFKEISSGFYNATPKIIFAREIAIKYLKTLLIFGDALSTASLKSIIKSADIDFNQYQVIQVFCNTVDISDGVNNRTHSLEEKIESAITNVKNGVFDHLFYWDFRAFDNMNSQRNVADMAFQLYQSVIDSKTDETKNN